LQLYIFGELRPIELQRLKDKFWNYAFYKFCFLFGVLGLENLNELILWISWFFILSIGILFCQLSKDRFELVRFKISSSSNYIFLFNSYQYHLQFLINHLSKLFISLSPSFAYASVYSPFVFLLD
jgi:hypothetical protein